MSESGSPHDRSLCGLTYPQGALRGQHLGGLASFHEQASAKASSRELTITSTAMAEVHIM